MGGDCVVRFCGKTRDEMNEILNFMCDIEEEVELNEKEKDMYNTAIQCIAVVMNRMLNRDLPIHYDDD